MLKPLVSNHLPPCSLTENMVKQRNMVQLKHFSTKFVIHSFNVTLSALQTVYVGTLSPCADSEGE